MYFLVGEKYYVISAPIEMSKYFFLNVNPDSLTHSHSERYGKMHFRVALYCKCFVLALGRMNSDMRHHTVYHLDEMKLGKGEQFLTVIWSERHRRMGWITGCPVILIHS